MGTNQFGFETGSGASVPQVSQTTNLAVSAVNLPESAETKLRNVMALRLVANGQIRPALEDARAGMQGFHSRIQEHYSRPWNDLSADPGFANSHGGRGLAGELRTLERFLAAAGAAERIYAQDLPLTRASLRTMGELAFEVVRFVNRNRGDLQEAAAVELGKGDTAEHLKASVEAAKERIDNVEHSWPVFEAAWAAVQGDLDTRAKLPAVSIHERLTPERAPRQFAPSMVVSTLWPEKESLHATAPGSQLLLIQPDALAVVTALHKDEIAAHLRAKLEALYSKAEAAGILVLSATDRQRALKAAKADLLATERKLAQIFWNEFTQHGRTPDVLSFETDPRAILGVE